MEVLENIEESATGSLLYSLSTGLFGSHFAGGAEPPLNDKLYIAQANIIKDIAPVSYTHLDVYKRQLRGCTSAQIKSRDYLVTDPRRPLNRQDVYKRQVKTFVNIVTKYDFDVDLVSGRYAVDAKSIMGIFSLDLSKPIKMEIHSETPDAFLNEIKPFIVD